MYIFFGKNQNYLAHVRNEPNNDFFLKKTCLQYQNTEGRLSKNSVKISVF